MSCEDVLYILSYFEGKIDIYECVYYYKDISKNNNADETFLLEKYIDYLEGNYVNIDGDYLFEIEEYLLNIISCFLKLKGFEVDINYIDMVDIKKYVIRCR